MKCAFIPQSIFEYVKHFYPRFVVLFLARDVDVVRPIEEESESV